jgi:hypothetical protein
MGVALRLPAGAIGVREENCTASPSRIEIVGLQRGYKAPCHCGKSCTRKDKGCKSDHGRGDGKAPYERRKRRKRKSPSTKHLASHEATGAVAAKQLEDGGVTATGIKHGGVTSLRDGGVARSTNIGVKGEEITRFFVLCSFRQCATTRSILIYSPVVMKTYTTNDINM